MQISAITNTLHGMFYLFYNCNTLSSIIQQKKLFPVLVATQYNAKFAACFLYRPLAFFGMVNKGVYFFSLKDDIFGKQIKKGRCLSKGEWILPIFNLLFKLGWANAKKQVGQGGLVGWTLIFILFLLLNYVKIKKGQTSNLVLNL